MTEAAAIADGPSPAERPKIKLGAGHHALLAAAEGSDPDKLLDNLLGPDRAARPVIVVSGGADNPDGPGELDDDARRRTEKAAGLAIASAAAATQAIVVYEGTNSGVVATIAGTQPLTDDAHLVLLGVVPPGKASREAEAAGNRSVLGPHHSYIVAADTPEWGDATRLLLILASRLAHGRPVVMVLVGGGDVAETEVLEAVRRNWPVFVVDGTGKAGGAGKPALAQLIASRRRALRSRARKFAASRAFQRFQRTERAANGASQKACLDEIARAGDIRLFTERNLDQLGPQLAWELREEPVLKDAWRTFATYDLRANRARATFKWFQASILVLGVAATLLALIQYQLGDPSGHGRLHWVVVVVPILVSALIAWSSRRADGRRWIMLRAAAEAIKAEVYRYRTGTEVYGEDQAPRQRDNHHNKAAPGQADNPRIKRELPSSARQMQLLQAHLAQIDAGLVRTEASMGILAPYSGPLPPETFDTARRDDGLSPLDANHYLQIRVEDQIRYFHHRVRYLHRMRTVLELLAIAASGAGAIVAAFGADAWVGLTSGMSAAAVAYLGYLQIENTIIAYNRTAARLAGLAREWRARSPRQREDRAMLRQLVKDTEAALTNERAGWVHQMSEALQDLRDRQAEAAGRIRAEGPQADSPSPGNEDRQ